MIRSSAGIFMKENVVLGTNETSPLSGDVWGSPVGARGNFISEKALRSLLDSADAEGRPKQLQNPAKCIMRSG